LQQRRVEVHRGAGRPADAVDEGASRGIEIALVRRSDYVARRPAGNRYPFQSNANGPRLSRLFPARRANTEADLPVRGTHQVALNQAVTRQLRRVGSRNRRREALHTGLPSPSGLTARIAGGVILRDMSRATGSPRWSYKALQSLAEFPSPMKQSSLNRVNGNSHDSSGLFRRSLVKLTQLECPPCSVG
jgi:hypothetical protein